MQLQLRLRSGGCCCSSDDAAFKYVASKKEDNLTDEPLNTAEASEIARLSRAESVSKLTNEPSAFMISMKRKYIITKAMLSHGINEEVDQFEVEIQESISEMREKDRRRVKEWLDSVHRALRGRKPSDFPPIPGSKNKAKQQQQQQQQQKGASSPAKGDDLSHSMNSKQSGGIGGGAESATAAASSGVDDNNTKPSADASPEVHTIPTVEVVQPPPFFSPANKEDGGDVSPPPSFSSQQQEKQNSNFNSPSSQQQGGQHLSATVQPPHVVVQNESSFNSTGAGGDSSLPMSPSYGGSSGTGMIDQKSTNAEYSPTTSHQRESTASNDGRDFEGEGGKVALAGVGDTKRERIPRPTAETLGLTKHEDES